MATLFVFPSGQAIQPDTCTTVTHGSQAEATTHPVEDGGSIADHVVLKPNTVTLSTLWTPHPADETALPQGFDRPSEAFDLLSDALQQRQMIQIRSGTGDGIIYDNMVLLSVSMQRQFEDGDGRLIQVEAQQIQIVSGKTVKIKIAKSLKPKGQKIKTNVTPTRAQLATRAAIAVVTGSWGAALALGAGAVL